MRSHYVVSDVHGHLDDLVEGLVDVGLLDRRRRWSGRDDELWVLGDLFDRGPDGIGVLDLLRELQPQAAQAGGRVELLLGNHEVLALGMRWFGDRPVPADPDRSFADSWRRNRGRQDDQDALTDERQSWLLGRPTVAVLGEWLALHSDGAGYLDLGDSVESIDAEVAAVLASRDLDRTWALWRTMTASRFAFVGDDGVEAVDAITSRLGGSRVVHGHTTIPDLLRARGQDARVRHDGRVLACAEGRALAIDGGRYEGGPLLVVRLEDHEPAAGSPPA